jgi:hypothetical protein
MVKARMKHVSRGTKKGVKGTGGHKRGPRTIAKAKGIAMKPRGKGPMKQSLVHRMEKSDPAV